MEGVTEHPGLRYGRTEMRLIPGAVIGWVVAAAAPATAGPVPCLHEDGAVADQIAVDGMLDDWDGVAPTRVGGKAAGASYDLRCVYDDHDVALIVDVRDDRVIRVGKGKASEDVVEVTLGSGKP